MGLPSLLMPVEEVIWQQIQVSLTAMSLSSPMPLAEWFVAKAASVLAMGSVTQSAASVNVHLGSLAMCARRAIVRVLLKSDRSALAMAIAKWVNASALLGGAWHKALSSAHRNLKHAPMRFAQVAVASMGSASMADACASKAGRVSIAKIHSAQMIARVMVNASSNRHTALASVSVILNGEEQVANVLPCTRSSGSARMTAQAMVCAWMACVHATLASRVPTALTSPAQQDSQVRNATGHVASMTVMVEGSA